MCKQITKHTRLFGFTRRGYADTLLVSVFETVRWILQQILELGDSRMQNNISPSFFDNMPIRSRPESSAPTPRTRIMNDRNRIPYAQKEFRRKTLRWTRLCCESRDTRRRRLRLESLEDRRLLATISQISNHLINRDTSTSPISFRIADPEGAVGDLNVSATASDTMLVPSSGIRIEGTGEDRTLVVTPAPERTGTSTITVNVSDNTTSVAESFVLTVSPTTGLQFNFTYADDGTGQGFDDPTLGEQRKAALEDAAAILGRTFAHSATLDIRIYDSRDAITECGNLSLGCADIPFGPTRNPGFDNPGPIELKVLSGRDPNGATADAGLWINFANDFALGDFVGPGQDDFKTTVIHELLHPMGWISSIEPGGGSEFGTDTVWGAYERFIADSNGDSIVDPVTFVLDQTRWDASKTTSLTFNGTSAMLANSGNPVPLYAPSVFDIGSSVSHVNDDDPNISHTTHVMVANGQKGLNARRLHPVERGILQDLGYTTVGEVISTASVSISQAPVTLAEGNAGTTNFSFTVTRSDTSSNPSVTYAVTGSGSNPAEVDDFVGDTFPGGQVNFSGDSATATITIPVAGDTAVEPDEGFTVTISGPDVAPSMSTATGTIAGDDVAGDPMVTVSAAGPNGAGDNADLSSGSQPTSWSAQRSSLRQMAILLPANPSSTPVATDVVLMNRTTNAAITLNDSQLSLDGTTVTIDLNDGQLPEGVYDLTVRASLTGGGDFILAGDNTNKLFVKQSDFNGDSEVNLVDFSTFRYWFGQSVDSEPPLAANSAPAYVDLNRDGEINLLDFSDFRSSFGTSINFTTTATAAGGASFGETDHSSDPSTDVARTARPETMGFLSLDRSEASSSSVTLGEGEISAGSFLNVSNASFRKRHQHAASENQVERDDVLPRHQFVGPISSTSTTDRARDIESLHVDEMLSDQAILEELLNPVGL